MFMKTIITILFFLLLISCESERNSIYNCEYSIGYKSLMIHPYQYYPLSANPYYNKQCAERQILNNIQKELIEEEDVRSLSFTLVKTSLKDILDTYNYTTSLYFNDVCLELKDNVFLSNSIRKISVSSSINSNYKLVAKNISYLSLYYLENDTINIFKDSHIDTLYIASDGFKRVDFENTTINILIPDNLSNLDSLDIDFIVRNNKVRKVYSKEEAKQYSLAKGQQDVY